MLVIVPGAIRCCHGHKNYYQQLIGCYVAGGGEHIAMAMVVVGHICTQNIMVVHNTIRYSQRQFLL